LIREIKVYRPDFDDISVDYLLFAENFEPQVHRVRYLASEFVIDESIEKQCKVTSLRYSDT
jgi:hypothetical protein